MALQPELSFDRNKRKHTALKEFTDREEPQNIYRNYLQRLSDNITDGKAEHLVLVYYGVGGIGKTSLKNKFKEDTMALTNAVSLELDFRNIRSRECASGLFELAISEGLNKKARNVKFVHFEAAYALYFKKKNPDYVFSKDDKSIFKNELGKEILSLLDPTGLFGLSKALIEELYTRFKKLGLNKELKEHLQQYVGLTLMEMENWLPVYFAYDLRNYQEKNGSKVVIFLDTFEQLNEYGTHELKSAARQGWVQELIKHLPNVLFAIFGRDKLSWGKEWEGSLDQHLLAELTGEYTDVFLSRCGIAEEDIRQKIALVSGGHPYYLDLSVETYFSIKNTGDVPDENSFGNEKKDVLVRFICNLHTVEIELLKVMSIPNYYDLDIFNLLIHEFNIPYPLTQFHSFNMYSFITRNEATGKHFIHQLMREGLTEHIDQVLSKRVNLMMFKYHQQNYERDRRQFLFECVYHKLQVTNREEFFHWLNETKLGFLKELQENGETILLGSVFDAVCQEHQSRHFSVQLFNIYEDIVHLAGNYQESVNLAERYLSAYTDEEIYRDKYLIKLKYRIVHHKMFYVNADKLVGELEIIKRNLSPENFFEEYCEVLYMLGGGVGFLTGNLDRSKSYLDTLRAIIDDKYPSTPSVELQNIYFRAVRKTVDYFRVMGNLDAASQLCTEYLDEERLNRYQLYLLCSYGETLRAQKQYHSAKRCFRKALKTTKALGIRGWTAHSYLSLANVDIDLGNYSVATNLIDSAKLVYLDINQQWGIVNSNIMLGRAMLATGKEEKEALDLIIAAKSIATKYSYRYEIGLATEIITTKKIGLQQLLYV